MAIMNKMPMRGGRPMPAPTKRPAPAQMQRPAPAPMVNRPAVMPPPVNKSPGAPSGDMAGGRMPPPDMVNRSPGAPSGDMAGGRMPPPPMRSPGGPSQTPTPVMPPPATTGGNMRPPGGPSMPPPPMRSPGGPANTGVVPPSPGLMKTMKKGGKVAPAKSKSTCMKTGGMVKSSASSRGDGIAQRGRTRGKYC